MMPPFADQLNLRLCHRCKYASPMAEDPRHCTRCHARLHHRKPDAIARTAALTLAALVFYIPANLLPIIHTRTLHHDSTTTILGSVMELWQAGAWDIALVLFTASVGVPVTKFLALGYLLVSVQRRSDRSRKERTRLYRLLELIGYWSMLDVFVAGLLSALVQFGPLGGIEPRAGILYFGLVVVLTMMATLSFDPRLIWDTGRSNE
jgi:paraquat-inducible protein A